ncbi:SpoIIE family protein phosphatase [Mycobacterium sp. 1274761.0]|uniref:SpoIIE family protein phosphatase n=1 Tax=Mycobacterium sp. 1274761.0 TaxID=1834077 RepID=UPI0007FDA593|nr:SpoIIE family protein phosphatase [Mycobacterium sp. 1274761.0]OBK71214.1 histidine kinase [Mycobacterium sp. 1274761.0]
MIGDGGPGSHAAVFSADPDVGRDLVQVDWGGTPLGSPSGWPQSLQTTVSILLSSRFPMWMAWGPELTFFCNAAYRRDTLGRKYPWALGRPANEVWSEIWDDIGPRIDRVLSTGQATWDEGLLLFLERSGYPEETYHTFSYSPLRDDEGHVVGMLCVVSEDTQRVIGERRMATLRDLGSDRSVARTEEESLAFAHRQLAKNPRDMPFTMTYLFDEAGDARLAGMSGIAPGHPAAPAVLRADDSTGWPVARAARGESVLVDLAGAPYTDLPTGAWPEPPVKALVVPLIEQGGISSGFLVAALNRYRPINERNTGLVTLVAAHIAAGIGSARSFRAQQRRAEELAELDRAKTIFFSNISHEFRTPLTLILDPVAELRGRTAGMDDEARENLDVVWRNGLRLTKLVNTLLDFSRIEAGRAQAHYEPVDLAAVTADLASVFRSAVDRAGLEFYVDCPALEEPVYVDRDMWEKVVLNLLSNALKFTFEGAISIRVRRDRDEAVVTVTDTGIGVPAEEMPRLFERFHRIESSYARSHEGSGIGLALVEELVRLHGGTITADSVEGQGTTFTIRLRFGAEHLPADAVAPTRARRAPSDIAEPFVQEALRWMPADPAADNQHVAVDRLPDAAVNAAASADSTTRVLIADDNADMREYLGRLLSAAGYRVDSATDGQQALDAVRADIPDLVISDVMMPRLDGLALVAALRSDARTAAVPVLLLSARAGQEASIEGLEAGADDYLVKPFAAAELLARARAIIELARLRTHHSRWRAALVDSLQEAFFACDEQGAIVEINAAFAEIIGYGPDGLPYEPPFPWWPSADVDPQARRQIESAFETLLNDDHGTYTIPMNHHDGHRIWAAVTFNHTQDPDTGRRVTVGTFRDVTAEHYTVQRETALASLGQRLVQADSVDAAVRAAAQELHRLWQAHRVIAVILPHGGTETVAPHMVCVGEPSQWADLPVATQRMIRSLSEGDLLAVEATRPGFAGIALQHPGGVMVINIELAEKRPFTSEDGMLLTVLAGRLSQGLQRLHQIDQQRETALALQNAILGPATLPSGFAVRYQPASRPLAVGGDWYDVVDLDDGRIALIVGDCVGHGLSAATVMGQLRSACRALLLDIPSPSAALTAVDQFAQRLAGARCTTAFCAVLTPDSGELVYSSAGHPPPIMVLADGTMRLLDRARATPLGVSIKNRPRPEHREILPPRATLLLYTDGLVERRREPLDIGITRAAGVVQENRDSGLEDVAVHVMSGLAPGDGYQDDVAVLLYRQPGPLELELPADPSHLASTRAALKGWLTLAGVDADQSLKVLIATGEALSNAIEHGHRLVEGTIRLRARAYADRLHVTVSDGGSWKTPVAATHRGRGIALMRALMQDVTILPRDSGTTVHMHARIA